MFHQEGHRRRGRELGAVRKGPECQTRPAFWKISSEICPKLMLVKGEGGGRMGHKKRRWR